MHTLVAGSKTSAVPITVSLLEQTKWTHPALIASTGTIPLATAKVAGVVFSTFMFAFTEPILISILVSVLPGLRRIIAVVIVVVTIAILRQRQTAQHQCHRNCKGGHPHFSQHDFLPPGPLRPSRRKAGIPPNSLPSSPRALPRYLHACDAGRSQPCCLTEVKVRFGRKILM